MTISRPSLRQPVRVRRATPRMPERGMAPSSINGGASRSSKSWHRERRRGVIAAVTVAFLMGGLMSGYGVHSQMSQAAARAQARDTQIALATAKALDNGVVLFVPQYGNVCQRRWIDNATWRLREGGEIACDEAVSWNATMPAPQYQVERRLGAIRNVFQSKAVSKLD